MTLIHHARGAAEYVVTITCDDPSHEPRVISTLGYWPEPEGTIGFLPWLEGIHPDPGQPPALQTPRGEGRRWREQGHGDQLDGRGTPPRMDHATRWRFECVGCRTVPVSGKRMGSILDSLRANGVSCLNLSQLTAILNL